MIGNILSLFIGLPYYYCTICTYILTNFLPVRLNCLKIRTDQLQFSMNSALTIGMLLLLKSIWCISSIFCSVYLNYTEIFSLYKHFKTSLVRPELQGELWLAPWLLMVDTGKTFRLLYLRKNNFQFSFIWPDQNHVKTTTEKYKEESGKIVLKYWSAGPLLVFPSCTAAPTSDTACSSWWSTPLILSMTVAIVWNSPCQYFVTFALETKFLVWPGHGWPSLDKQKVIIFATEKRD